MRMRLSVCPKTGCPHYAHKDDHDNVVENDEDGWKEMTFCRLRCNERFDDSCDPDSDCESCQKVIPEKCPYRLELLMLQEKAK
jgi:hypothetical protein